MNDFIILEGTQGSLSSENVWVQNSNYVNEDWGNTPPEEVAIASGEYAWDVTGLKFVEEDVLFLDYLDAGNFTLEMRFKLIQIWWDAYNEAQEASINIM